MAKRKGKASQRMCAACRKRPVWHYKSNPGDKYCKRCYHKKWKKNSKQPPQF